MTDGPSLTAPAGHVDPVCGMTVDSGDAAGSSEYRGHTYYFCNPGCLERFKADPAAFVGDDRAAKMAERTAVAGARTYTCPMHPEIVRDRPGACPICGMALEPRMVWLEDTPNPELVDMTHRFWMALVFGAPVFVLTMADMVLGGGLMRF